MSKYKLLPYPDNTDLVGMYGGCEHMTESDWDKAIVDAKLVEEGTRAYLEVNASELIRVGFTGFTYGKGLCMWGWFEEI